MIANEGGNNVIEIEKIVWKVRANDVGLNAFAFASRLSNGNTFITDSGNNRIIEATKHKHVVLQYFTNKQKGSNTNPFRSNTVQLNIVIADQNNNGILKIDKNKRKSIENQYGILNHSGNGCNELNGLYTAFVVGDYTSQTGVK